MAAIDPDIEHQRPATGKEEKLKGALTAVAQARLGGRHFPGDGMSQVGLSGSFRIDPEYIECPTG